MTRLATRTHLFGWLPHALVGLLAVPFIVSQNSWFEWGNALWLLQLQTAHVAVYGLPSYFIDAPGQYFYPQNVFYAGPLFSLLAYPSVLFGAWTVFAAGTAAIFTASSAGISWTARNLGVPARLAILPGVLFACTPYLVSDLYGRGAWTELAAVAAFAVALGAATAITTGRARSPRVAVAVLALCVAAIAGSHNITLLLGALIAPPLALALLPVLRTTRREAIHRHLLVLAGAVIGVALCGAFLAPDVWLSGRTVIQTTTKYLLAVLWPFDSFTSIFHPGLALPAGETATDFHSQTLVSPLVWIAAVAAVLTWRRAFDRPTARSLGGLVIIGVGVTLLIVDPSWWLSFPKLLGAVQFSFRLVTYLALVTVLGVTVLLAMPAVARNRLAVIALVLATTWQVGLAAESAISAQARSGLGQPPATLANVNAETNPPAFQPGFLQASEYRLVPTPALPAPATAASVKPIGDDAPSEVILYGTQPPGTVVSTTVVQSPLIRVAGQVSDLGATQDGYAVLRVNHRTHGQWRATVTSVCGSCIRGIVGGAPFVLFAGRAATVLAALAIVGLLGYRRLRRLVRKRSVSASASGVPIS